MSEPTILPMSSAIVARFDELVAEAKAELQWELALASRELLFGVAIGPIAWRRDAGGLADIIARSEADT